MVSRDVPVVAINYSGNNHSHHHNQYSLYTISQHHSTSSSIKSQTKLLNNSNNSLLGFRKNPKNQSQTQGKLYLPLLQVDYFYV